MVASIAAGRYSDNYGERVDCALRGGTRATIDPPAPSTERTIAMDTDTEADTATRLRCALEQYSPVGGKFRQLVSALKSVERICMKMISKGEITRNEFIELVQRVFGPGYSRSMIIRALKSTSIRWREKRKSS